MEQHAQCFEQRQEHYLQILIRMSQHIAGKDVVLEDEETELGERTTCPTDVKDAPKKDKGKDKTSNDSD